MQKWLLPAQPTRGSCGCCSMCVPVSIPDNGAAAQGAQTGASRAGTGQGEPSPGLAPPHSSLIFHVDSQSFCAVQLGPGSSRAGTDPKGLLWDWVGSVPPHTLPDLTTASPGRETLIL